MHLKGRNMMLSTDATGTAKVIGASIDCSLDIDCDMIETSNPLSGRGKTFKPGRYSWRAGSNSLLQVGGDADAMAFVTKLKAGAAVSLTMTVYEDSTVVSGEYSLSGNAYVQKISIGAQLEGYTTYNIELQGSGTIE